MSEKMKETSPFEAGRRASTQWEQPENPFTDPLDRGQWADGLLDGRKALNWNMMNTVRAGASARWLSEAVSQELGMIMGKYLVSHGGEMLIAFRCGFVLASLEIDIPPLNEPANPNLWREFAMVVNRTMIGRPMTDIPVGNIALNRLARREGLRFVDMVMKGAFAPSDVKPGRLAQIQANLVDILQFIGATTEDIPAA